MEEIKMSAINMYEKMYKNDIEYINKRLDKALTDSDCMEHGYTCISINTKRAINDLRGRGFVVTRPVYSTRSNVYKVSWNIEEQA